MKHGNLKHGHATRRTKEYESWRSMRQRCKNPKCKKFNEYGGRGITICCRWDSFENFLADMGNCPKGKSLDRINNSLGYDPDNCRWASSKEQTINRRTTIFVSARGSDLVSLKDACKLLGLNYGSIYGLVRHKHMRPQDALENANARAAERIR